MALIICTECGKQFSDRAPACPNCGCPTEEVLKDLGDEVVPSVQMQTLADYNRQFDANNGNQRREFIKKELMDYVDNCGPIDAHEVEKKTGFRFMEIMMVMKRLGEDSQTPYRITNYGDTYVLSGGATVVKTPANAQSTATSPEVVVVRTSDAPSGERASVIKRGIVGGIVAGPAGAIVGAISAVDKNNKNK